MLALKNLSISRKLVLAFALLAGVMLAGDALIARQLGAFQADRLDGAELGTRLAATDALTARLLERELMLSAAKTDPAALSRLPEANAAVEGSLGALRAVTLTPVDAARLDRLEQMNAQYAQETAAAANGAPPEARDETAGNDKGQAMIGLARAVAQANQEAFRGLAQEQDGTPGTLKTALWSGSLLTLMAALGLCLLLMRGIAAPARSMARSLTKLSKGELDQAMPTLGRSDEFGAMAQAADVFRQNQIRTHALEAEAMDARARTETENRQTAHERQAQIAEQARVVETLEQALTRLSAGDLTCRIETALPERYESLRAEFNKAADHLHDMVGRVASSVSSIANGTSEIGHAADDLSRRTEQQAASLDKTASALDEITATVKHSAENAASVASSVAAARQDTERSGEVMREAVEAMTAIQKSSQQIARIIGVIDEIAFQTNLLALNAGVEAARAGDAGRGFAVVALEVRALAQRSSEAAKEIKTLIGASSTQVGNGVELVNRSGEVLTRIAAQVTQIDALVQEIAGSAREQSIGIADVNDAVNKMDRVTQQNAAMVEETTAATLSLRTETEELGRLVATFQVDATDHAVSQLRVLSSAMKTTSKPAAAPRAAPAAPVAPAAPRLPVAAAAPATAAAEDLGWEEF